MGILIRIVIALIVFVVAIWLIPAVLSALGVPMPENILTIIKVCCALAALVYIWRGPTPNWKPAP